MLCCQRHLLKKVIIKREYVDILTSQSCELKLRDNCALPFLGVNIDVYPSPVLELTLMCALFLSRS